MPNQGALYQGTQPTRGQLRGLGQRKVDNPLPGADSPRLRRDCPGGGERTQATPRSLDGKFRLKQILPPHSKDSAVLTGRFTAHGGVTGKVKVATQCLLPPNFNSGPIRHKTFSWSATSEPAGKTSRWCPDRARQVPKYGPFFFTDVIEKNTTCKTVAKAIKAGKITPQPTAAPTFSTPGWACGRSMTTGRYICTRRKASFSWVDAG